MTTFTSEEAKKLIESLDKFRGRLDAIKVETMSGLTLEVVTNLAALFAYEDTDMTLCYLGAGHSGPGFYAWPTEYPDEGSHFLGEGVGK